MFKLPFGSLPAHWGSAGKSREVARAEYELEGYELAKKLLEIKRDEMDNDTFLKRMWDIELKFNIIEEKEYHRNLATLIKDEKQQKLAILELDYREHIITDLEYEKQVATLKGEPWVTVLDMDFNGKNSLEGSFELDWNEFFVDKLRTEGYNGPTPDVIVNQWFITVCRNVAMEEFDGTGDFTANSEANLETMKRWSADSNSYGAGKKGYK